MFIINGYDIKANACGPRTSCFSYNRFPETASLFLIATIFRPCGYIVIINTENKAELELVSMMKNMTIC